MAKPIQKFESTHARSEQLVQLFEVLSAGAFTQAGEKIGTGNHHDLLRAAIVLSISAMDAYFTGKFVDMLVPYLKKEGPSDRLVALLTEAGLDTRQALKLLAMERPFRRIRTLMDAHMDTFTTQRAEAIDSLFIAFHLKDFTKCIAGIAKRKNLIAVINKTVERRHQIVHEGDLSPRGSLASIDLAKTRRQRKDVALFVRSAEDLCERRRRKTKSRSKIVKKSARRTK